jgi:hypothetical protein
MGAVKVTAGSLKGHYFRCPDADGSARRFGGYLFDGSLAYVDRDHDDQRILLTGGTTLRREGDILLAAGKRLSSTVAVRLNRTDRTIEITGPVAEADGFPLHLAAPWARKATVAGQAVPLVRKGDLVTVAALR